MKILKIILMVFGCIFSLLILSIFALIYIFPLFDHHDKQLQNAIASNNVKYITQNINKYKKDKIDFDQIASKKYYDMLDVFIMHNLVPDEVIKSCYKYDKPAIDLFVKKYGSTEDMYDYIISSLGPDKLSLYLLSSKQYNNSKILFDATMTGNYQIIKYLVEEKKVNVNVEDNEKLTPLFYLINYYDKHGETLFNDKKMYSFIYLVNNGADIHHKDISKRGILSYSYNTNIVFLKYLLDMGLDINEQDSLGNTILHYFYMNPGEGAYYNYAIRDYLISRNADVNIRNNDGKTPIDYMEKY